MADRICYKCHKRFIYSKADVVFREVYVDGGVIVERRVRCKKCGLLNLLSIGKKRHP